MQQFSLGKVDLPETDKNTPAYDTKEGIAIYIKSLEGLNRLRDDRHEAGYIRRERLHEFVILGHWSLDTCGNMGKADLEPKIVKLPDIITHEELWTYYLDTRLSSGCRSDIPATHLRCPVCQRGWSIENAHDVEVMHQTEVFDLQDFIGKTHAEMVQIFKARIDALYSIQPERLIRHDRYIDLTPDPKYDTIVANKNGWVGKKEEITGDYVIVEGDQTYFNMWTYYHIQCYRINQNQTMREKFEKLFKDSGFTQFVMKSIPNEYCGPSCMCCADWYEVTTPFADFKIGWRKRVINIECKKLKAEELFPDESTTKWKDGIHAWGWDKAQEYITKMYQELTK